MENNTHANTYFENYTPPNRINNLLALTGCQSQHQIYGVIAIQGTPPAPPGPYLYKVFMVSATEGWSVGQKNIIRHFHNGTWSTYST